MADYDRTFKDSERSAAPRHDGVAAPRAVVGGLLLTIGVGATLWVLTVVIGLITSEAIPGLVKSITPATQAVISDASQNRIALDPELFSMIGYGMVCFLCVVAASIAHGLTRGGLALLLPSKSKGGSGDAAEKYYPK